jgi:hypothetical protein
MSLQDALNQCCSFNKIIESSKQSRGPFYFESNTSSLQSVPARVVAGFVGGAASPTLEGTSVIHRDETSYASQLIHSFEPSDPTRNRSLIAPAPKETAESNCSSCLRPVDLSCLSCSKCLNTWHGSCLINAGRLHPGQKAFVCCFCRSCERCGRGPLSEKELLLDCVKCGISRHSYCAVPRVDSLPFVGLWLCERCVVCQSCGTRSSSSWHDNSTVCGACFVKRKQGDCCPVCLVAYNADSEEAAVRCGTCLCFVHANGRCDNGQVTETLWKSLKAGGGSFVCSICAAVPELVPVPDAELDRKLDDRLRTLGRIDGGATGGGGTKRNGVFFVPCN